MVRAAKTSTTTPVVSAPQTPVVDKVKVPKKKTVSETPVAAPAPVSAPAPVDAVVSDDSSTPLLAKLAEFGAKIQQLTTLLSLLKTEYKGLEKAVSREVKNAQKASKKKKRSSGNRQPSGFVKPTLISDELAAFLGKEKGSELARTAVSKEINTYIIANKLQDAANGRKINADAKLAKLLKLEKNDELTYFNLQRYMKHHFIKATPVA
jgi:chromatin remodeling complex protein RSC6